MSRRQHTASRVRSPTISMLLLVSAVIGMPAYSAEPAQLDMEDAVAVYGPWIFPAIKILARCEDYRVLVVYAAGTDMLFLDKLVLGDSQSTFSAEDGISFSQFNYYEDDNIIKDISCRLLNSSVEITGKGWNGHENQDFSFMISYDVNIRTYEYHEQSIPENAHSK